MHRSYNKTNAKDMRPIVVKVLQGYTAVIDCIDPTQSNNITDFKWKFKNVRILTNENKYTISDKGVLRVQNVQLDDTGLYCCFANTTYGTEAKQFELKIQGKVFIDIPLIYIYIYIYIFVCVCVCVDILSIFILIVYSASNVCCHSTL